MKKFYLSIIAALIMIPSVFSQQIWDNFQDIRKADYGFIHGVLIPYTGNPDPTGANTSTTVATYLRNSAEQFDVIVIGGEMADVTDYVTGTKSISLDVWSPAAGISVQVTLENAELAANPFPAGRHSTYFGTTTVANSWETVTLSFDSQPDPTIPSDSVNSLVLLFNPDSFTDDTYFFDNLSGPELANDPCEGVTPDFDIFNDFECNQNVSYTFSHSGTNFRRVINPDMTGNTSSHVASYTRNGGEEFDVIVGSFSEALDIGSNDEIKIDVWDPASPTEVRVSLQIDDGSGFPIDVMDTGAVTTGSGAWETLTFPIGDAAGEGINQFVLLFDPGDFTFDNYYFDNMIQSRGTGTAIEDLDNLNSVKLFPNPSSDMVTIEYVLSESEIVSARIFDITGRNLKTIEGIRASNGVNQIYFSVNDFNAGLYFYQLTIDGQSTGNSFSVIK